MSILAYHPAWEESRQRLTAWWKGQDIGRAALQITVPRSQPIEDIPALPLPEGVLAPSYTTRSMAFRVNQALRACNYNYYLGEAVPSVASGDLAPNCLALYLGCKGVEMQDTVWCQPCIAKPEAATFDYDPENFYWTFSLEAYQQVAPHAKGNFLQAFPDFIEGLDTLAAMRGTEHLLEDLIFRPEWVHASLRQITDRYFRYYDIIYNIIRDDIGGSWFWAWAPGRMAKFQCDFSAMMSPAMFHDFMVPILTEMTERVAHSMYHWDGPAAICHHDALLSIPRLDMLQWTPGAGAEDCMHERWWPMFHKTLDAGKKLLLNGGGKEELLALKREFGEKSKNIMIQTSASTRQEAEAYIKLMEI